MSIKLVKVDVAVRLFNGSSYDTWILLLEFVYQGLCFRAERYAL
jgi:hypothetical protein